LTTVAVSDTHLCARGPVALDSHLEKKVGPAGLVVHAAERSALVQLIFQEYAEIAQRNSLLPEEFPLPTVQVGEFASSLAMYADLSLRGVVPPDALFVDVVGADKAVGKSGEIKRIAERRRDESLMVVVSRDETTQQVLKALGKSVAEIRDFEVTPYMIVDEKKRLIVVPLDSKKRRGTASSTAVRKALEGCDFVKLRTLMPDDALEYLLSIPDVARYRALHRGAVEL